MLFVVDIKVSLQFILQHFMWFYVILGAKGTKGLGNKGFIETLGTRVIHNSACQLKYIPHVLHKKLSNVDSAMFLQFIYIFPSFFHNVYKYESPSSVSLWKWVAIFPFNSQFTFLQECKLLFACSFPCFSRSFCLL